MTDKEYRNQKNRLRKLIKKWHTKIGMSWWKVDYVYSRTNKQNESDATYRPIDYICLMDTSTDFYYLDARITFYLPTVKDTEDDVLEESLIHEYMHVYLNPLKDDNKAKEEELVATKLARAILWAVK